MWREEDIVRIYIGVNWFDVHLEKRISLRLSLALAQCRMKTVMYIIMHEALYCIVLYCDRSYKYYIPLSGCLSRISIEWSGIIVRKNLPN